MKKLIAASILALLATGGSMTIAKADPGPNGNNNHGLCTAYFAGSDNGRAHKRNAPPFQALEAAAEAEGDTQDERDAAVREYCQETDPKFKG